MAYTDTTGVNGVLGPHAATSSTAVTLDQLTTMIDGIAAQIDTVLKGAGVAAVPVTGGLDSTFNTFLVEVNKWGAAGEYLKGLFPEAVGPGESPAFAFWEKKYQDTLKAWREGKDLPAGLLSGPNDPGPSTYFTRDPDEEETLGDLMENSDRTRIGDRF